MFHFVQYSLPCILRPSDAAGPPTIGSFGTLDEVSKTILPEADGVKSNMVDSYTSKNAYVYDYVVDQNGRPKKHIKVSEHPREESLPASGKGFRNVLFLLTSREPSYRADHTIRIQSR